MWVFQKTNGCRYYSELSTHRLSRFWSNQLGNGVFRVHNLQTLVSLERCSEKNTIKWLWAPACYNQWKALKIPISWLIWCTFFLFFQRINYRRLWKTLSSAVGLGIEVSCLTQLSLRDSRGKSEAQANASVIFPSFFFLYRANSALFIFCSLWFWLSFKLWFCPMLWLLSQRLVILIKVPWKKTQHHCFRS